MSLVRENQLREVIDEVLLNGCIRRFHAEHVLVARLERLDACFIVLVRTFLPFFADEPISDITIARLDWVSYEPLSRVFV